jgi:hypothetical protein
MDRNQTIRSPQAESIIGPALKIGALSGMYLHIFSSPESKPQNITPSGSFSNQIDHDFCHHLPYFSYQTALPLASLTKTPGAAGFVTGSVAGVIRNSPPLLFGIGSGLQWFGLGTTYWGESM